MTVPKCRTPAISGVLNVLHVGLYDRQRIPRDEFLQQVHAVIIGGDLSGDGVVDLAVGAKGDGDVWILLLNPDGTVKSQIKSVDGDANEETGAAVANLGDLDGNGITDLAVGSPGAEVGVLPTAQDTGVHRAAHRHRSAGGGPSARR